MAHLSLAETLFETMLQTHGLLVQDKERIERELSAAPKQQSQLRRGAKEPDFGKPPELEGAERLLRD